MSLPPPGRICGATGAREARAAAAHGQLHGEGAGRSSGERRQARQPGSARRGPVRGRLHDARQLPKTLARVEGGPHLCLPQAVAVDGGHGLPEEGLRHGGSALLGGRHFGHEQPPLGRKGAHSIQARSGPRPGGLKVRERAHGKGPAGPACPGQAGRGRGPEGAVCRGGNGTSVPRREHGQRALGLSSQIVGLGQPGRAELCR